MDILFLLRCGFIGNTILIIGMSQENPRTPFSLEAEHSRHQPNMADSPK